MIRKSCATLLLVFSSLSSAQAATFIEIYGGRSNVKFENWYGYDQYPGYIGSAYFKIAFYDNNGDYVFNDGDTVPGGRTYDDLNYGSLAYDEPQRILKGGLDRNKNPFVYSFYAEYFSGPAKQFSEDSFSINRWQVGTKRGQLYTAEGDGDLFSYSWSGDVTYEFKINGVSQVVPLPWSAALLPAGLALLGGFGRRRRMIG